MARAGTRRGRGFTLIEVLVVLLIITTFSGLVAFSLEGVRNRSLDNEIERLRAVLEYASDTASVKGTPIAVDFMPDGYRFSAMQTDGTWKLLFAPPELSAQTWPANVNVLGLEIDQVASRPPYRLVFGHEAPEFVLRLDTPQGLQTLRGGLLGAVAREQSAAVGS